uniref:Ig-like domain-containing protein n=1 Tax=Electrophorus electricus TaxID=8005 RepID=A0A4W4E0Z2_ELEEL
MNLVELFIEIDSVFCADQIGLETIRPDQPTMSTNEKHSITLSCTYDGSPFSLLWYRQKPGSRPEFLLLIDEDDRYTVKAEPPYPYLSIKLHKNNKKVDLLISSASVSDSALYYCALWPTVTKNPAMLYKNCVGT